METRRRFALDAFGTSVAQPDGVSKTLRLHVRVDPQRTTLVFHQFPVRIGRDKSNECPLGFEFVSRHHAHLELEDGALYLCDDDSTCGTFVRGGAERLATHARVKLDDVGNEFQIGHGIGSTITIRAELFDDTDRSAFDDTLDGALTIPPDPPGANDTQPYAKAQIDPAGVDAGALLRNFQGVFEAQRHAWFEARHALLQALGALDPSRARAVLEALIVECPWLSDDGEIGKMAKSVGAALSVKPSRTRLIDGDIALSRLRELAAAHVPFAPPLSGPEAILRFASRLDLVLRTIFDGVGALRVAYQSEAERAAMGNELDLFDLGAFALDWTRSDSHARGRIENIFTTLLTQRSALVKETAECFWRLAPAAIEATTRTALGPLKHRALWRRYCEEYRALLGGERDEIAEQRASGVARIGGGADHTPSGVAIPEASVA